MVIQHPKEHAVAECKKHVLDADVGAERVFGVVPDADDNGVPAIEKSNKPDFWESYFSGSYAVRVFRR